MKKLFQNLIRETDLINLLQRNEKEISVVIKKFQGLFEAKKDLDLKLQEYDRNCESVKQEFNTIVRENKFIKQENESKKRENPTIGDKSVRALCPKAF